jgi:hypothetical protein
MDAVGLERVALDLALAHEQEVSTAPARLTRPPRVSTSSKRRSALSKSGASTSIRPPYVSSPSTLPSRFSRSSRAMATASVVPSGSLVRIVSGRSLPSSRASS